VSDKPQYSGALLALSDVSLRIHDTPILNNISFEIESGQTLGVIGESGSGKSMTALSIMQLLPRGSVLNGNIRFQGQDLNTVSEERMCEIRGSDIGMIFQEPMTALNPVKSIGDQVSESIRLHRRVNAEEALTITKQTLERVGLPNTQFPLSRYPHELSGGQRQRVVIAIAVACKPQLLIADEPTTALDVTTQAGILDLLKNLQKDEGLALVLITHDLAVVSNAADDVLVMKAGNIVEQGNLRSVFRRPANAYTKLLFDASALTQIEKMRTGIEKQNQHSVEESSTNGGNVSDASGGNVGDTNAESINPKNASDEHKIVSQGTLKSTAIPLLQVNDLVCEYRVPQAGWFKRPRSFRAVNQVSFDIHHGESVGLVGESGCGKSTLTRALLGLMKLHSGSIKLNGESVSAAQEVSREARQKMQMVFQDPYGSFNPRHKVSRLISEPLFLLDKRPGKSDTLKLVHDALESVGMHSSDANKFIHEFSGGQRQRIAIARALIIKPALILLDEAVSALDVSVRAQVLELLHDLAKREGLAYLFISHDLSVVQRVSDRVLVMQKGKIVERGNTQHIFNDPQHPYTQQLISAAPKLLIPD